MGSLCRSRQQGQNPHSDLDFVGGQFSQVTTPNVKSLLEDFDTQLDLDINIQQVRCQKVLAPQDQSTHRVGKSLNGTYASFSTRVVGVSATEDQSGRPVYDLESESEPEPELLLQPETRPISHDQLVIEVKGIYAGLVMVEAKCFDVDSKQSQLTQNTPRLSHQQWQALIALHETLLHEHHDFFLASQHPSASPALTRLAAKYAMPARMWRHGIHAFLEVLRHRLPESLDHMLAFIYIAYSMMALLHETVPAFEDTWIECLGDLRRYRMAIEDDDIRDRQIWSGVARFWYSKAAQKKSQFRGRLYHHLAILVQPYNLHQLSLYTRSCIWLYPLESTRSSITILFNPGGDIRSSFGTGVISGDTSSPKLTPKSSRNPCNLFYSKEELEQAGLLEIVHLKAAEIISIRPNKDSDWRLEIVSLPGVRNGRKRRASTRLGRPNRPDQAFEKERIEAWSLGAISSWKSASGKCDPSKWSCPFGKYGSSEEKHLSRFPYAFTTALSKAVKGLSSARKARANFPILPLLWLNLFPVSLAEPDRTIGLASNSEQGVNERLPFSTLLLGLIPWVFVLLSSVFARMTENGILIPAAMMMASNLAWLRISGDQRINDGIDLR